MNSRILKSLCWFLVALFSLASAAAVQIGTTQATGMVEDATNARVTGASVKLINTHTGAENDATTNRSGIFFLPDIIPGRYILQITKNGFATVQVTGIRLDAGDCRQFLIHLKVGPVSETVTVNASVIAWNRKDASVSTTIGGKFISNLPLKGRSLHGLVSAIPGIVPLNPQSVNLSHGSQGNFSVNGQTTDANYYMVDGVAANINGGFPINVTQSASDGSIAAATAVGTTQVLTSVEALKKIRVLTSSYSAQYGYSPGGQFRISTRSGTNTLHGSVYDYLQNNVFNANDWFNRHYSLPKTAMRQNDFGATLGGPVELPHHLRKHNRTFFFVNYEGLRIMQPFAAHMQYVPSPSLRTESAGLQSLLNAFPLPTGREIDLPSGNPSGLAPFLEAYSLPAHVNSVSARIDQKLFSRASFFLRYSQTPSDAEFRQLSSLTSSTVRSRFYIFGMNVRLTRSLSNNLRFSRATDRAYRTTALDSFGGAVPTDLRTVLGDGNYSEPDSSFDEAYIRIPGVGSTSIVQDHAQDALSQIDTTDAFRLVKAHQVITFGADARYLSPPIETLGTFLRSSFYNRDAILSNRASNVSYTYNYFNTNVSGAMTLRYWSAFAQGEWRMLPSLTLSFGVRWELNSHPSMTSLAPYAFSGSVASPSTLARATQVSSLWRNDWNNFAPRFGIAWSPGRQGPSRTVLRAGAGVFYGTANKVAVEAGSDGLGIANSDALTNVSLPITPEEYFYFATALRNSYTGGLAYLVPLHLQLPYTIEWNVSAEQALGRSQTLTASYVGAAGRRLLKRRIVNVNSENPDFGNVAYYPNHLTSSYNALQIKFQTELALGVDALASYTWSHTLDYGSTSPLYPFTYANANQDIRHDFQAAFTWNLGSLTQNCAAGKLLKGWNLDGRIGARTGFPITLYGNMHREEFNGYRYYSGVDLIPGRPLYLYGPQYPGGRMLNGGPDASRPAFVLPNGTGAGNTPRNIARGHGAFQVDLAIQKDIPIQNRLHAQFRVDAFNLFNHPNFGYIDPYLIDRQFGQVTKMLNASQSAISPVYQEGGPRTLQFSLKFQF